MGMLEMVAPFAEKHNFFFFWFKQSIALSHIANLDLTGIRFVSNSRLLAIADVLCRLGWCTVLSAASSSTSGRNEACGRLVTILMIIRFHIQRGRRFSPARTTDDIILY